MDADHEDFRCTITAGARHGQPHHHRRVPLPIRTVPPVAGVIGASGYRSAPCSSCRICFVGIAPGVGVLALVPPPSALGTCAHQLARNRSIPLPDMDVSNHSLRPGNRRPVAGGTPRNRSVSPLHGLPQARRGRPSRHGPWSGPPATTAYYFRPIPRSRVIFGRAAAKNFRYRSARRWRTSPARLIIADFEQPPGPTWTGASNRMW